MKYPPLNMENNTFSFLNTTVFQSTVEPPLTATSLQQSPLYNGYSFFVSADRPYTNSFNLVTTEMATKASPNFETSLWVTAS